MGPTPVYGARAENPLQNADFAMKQTNICRLSGDINKTIKPYSIYAYCLRTTQYVMYTRRRRTKDAASSVI